MAGIDWSPRLRTMVVGFATVVLMTTAGMVAPSLAYADTTIGDCVVVSNPTFEHHSMCAGGDLNRADLSGLDLSWADLSFAHLQASMMISTNLTHANLHGAYTKNAVMSFAEPRYATLVGADLTGVSLDGADLTGAWVTNHDLVGKNLTGTILTGAHLEGTNLTGQDLSNKDLTGTVLTGANVTNANLSGALFTGTLLVPGNVSTVAPSASGAIVSFAATGGVTGATHGACTTAGAPITSPTLFPIGTTTVSCQVFGSDSPRSEASGNFTVTVAGVAPQFTADDPPATGTFGVGYGPYTFAASGVPAAVVFDYAGSGGGVPWNEGMFPPGVTLDAITGVFAGVPTQAGNYQFIVRAKNGIGPDAISRVINITIAKAPQTTAFISAPPAAPVVGVDYPLSASATTGLPVVFGTSTPDVCSVSGASVRYDHVGTCVVTADQPGDASYLAAPQVTQTLPVPAPGTQEITFPFNGLEVLESTSYWPVATGGGSGNPVTFSLDSTSSGCAILGGIVTFTRSGTCVINAEQLGNADYSAAKASQSFTVVGLYRITSTGALPTGTVGQPYSFSLTTDGGAGVPIDWTLDSGALPLGLTLHLDGTITGTPIAAGTATAVVSAGGHDTASISLTIAPAAIVPPPVVPKFTADSPASGTVGVSYGPYTFAVSGMPGPVFSYAGSGGGVPGNEGVIPPGLSLDATTGALSGVPTEAGNFQFLVSASNGIGPDALSRVVHIAIAKAAQTARFTSEAPTQPVVGVGYPLAASASSGLPVVFSTSTPAVCSVTGSTVRYSHVGTCVVTANQAGNTNYLAAAEATQTLSVAGRAPQAISFDVRNPVGAVEGGTYVVAATGGGSGNAVTFSLDSTSSGCFILDDTVSFTGAGTCVINAEQAGDPDYSPGSARQSFAVAAMLRITSAGTLPNATVGQPYAVTLAASGGDTSPHVWALASGTLSAGLLLNPNGTITGTPIAPGTVDAVVSVDGQVTASISFTIAPAAVVPPPVVVPQPPAAPPAALVEPLDPRTEVLAATGFSVFPVLSVGGVLLLLGLFLIQRHIRLRGTRH